MIGQVAGWIRKQPAVARLALKCMPDWRWTIQIKPIGPFIIRMRQHRSYWLRDPLAQDQFIFGAIQRLLKPGDVVYDVGANIGLYVRFLSSQFQAGRVIAFEPMAATYALMRENVELDPEVARHTTTFQLALGDVESDENLQIDDMSSQTSALDRVTGGKPASGRGFYGLPSRVERVHVVPLDTLIEREKLPAPNLMKIDIEGAAPLALTGMQKALAEHHPDLIIETHGIDEALAVLRALQPLGYHCYGIVERGGAEGRFLELTEQDVKPSGHDFWQPHHIIASVDASKLQEPIKPHHCWRT